MPMLTIPYARQQAPNYDDYTRTMADLMLQNQRAAADIRQRRAAGNQAAWNRAGDITMSAFGQYYADKDKQKEIDRREAQLAKENKRAEEKLELERQQLKDAAEERKLTRERQDRLERNQNAIELAKNTVPGTTVDDDYYERLIANTAAASRYRELPAQEALPAWQGEAVGDAMADAGPAQPGLPHAYQRVANWDENVQAETLKRQQEATAAQILNMRQDNLRASQALADTAAYREDMLQTRRFLAEAAADQRRVQNMLALSGQVKSHPAYTKMLDFESGLQAVETGLKQDNGLGDIAAINAFQRLVDPGVSVREGDVRLLESAVSLASRMNPAFWVEKIQGGDRLPQAMREQMQQAARDLYVARTNTYNETVGDTFRQQAQAAQIPFSLIGRDFQIPNFGTTPAGGKPGGDDFWNDKPPGKKP